MQLLVAILSNFQVLALGDEQAVGLDTWCPKILMKSGLVRRPEKNAGQGGREPTFRLK